MPESESAATRTLDEAVYDLGVALARLPPGPLAQLRRAEPGDGVASFWRIYHQQGLGAHRIRDIDWEWVVIALALLTPTGDPADKRSAHADVVPLGRALSHAGVSEPRVAKLLNSTLSQRRVALLRLVRRLARADARFDTRELASLLLFPHADPGARDNALRRLAKAYYAAEAAAEREDSDA